MSGQRAPLVVVIGVAGSGKSTIGEQLARRLGVEFAEGDDLHPEANVAKMRRGVPLTDADRWPWLATIGQWLAEHAATGGVASCSALKRSYRDLLAGAAPAVWFLHADAPPELIKQRMRARQGHFMPESLVDSQFADLEPLSGDENGARLDISGDPEAVADRAERAVLAR
jgi:gluconokinase